MIQRVILLFAIMMEKRKKQLEKRKQQLEKYKAEGYRIAIKDNRKTCTDCEDEKDSIEFPLQKRKQNMTVYLHSRCSECEKDRLKKRRDNGGNFPDDIRDMIIQRDGRCVYCHSTENLTADHIIPQSICNEGMASTISNGQCLCQSCNSGKRDRLIRESMNRISSKTFRHIVKPEYLKLAMMRKLEQRPITINGIDLTELRFTEKPSKESA